MRKNSVKNTRVNAEVMRVIAGAIRRSKDPRIGPLTSVTDAVVAPDLKTCKVWISVLGSEEDKRLTEEGLKSANGYIRSVLAHELNMRYTPELTFIMDDSAAYAIDISRKIDEVMEQDKRAQAARGELTDTDTDAGDDADDAAD